MSPVITLSGNNVVIQSQISSRTRIKPSKLMESDSKVKYREKYIAPDWNSEMPYGGKVYLARKKKPEPYWIFGIELSLILLTVVIFYYSYYHLEYVYSHTVKLYAHLGYKEAQHQIGQRYLRGIGVEQHHPSAMHWFRKAADQGHPHSAYNLAIAKLKGFHDLDKGETRRLLDHAVKHGIEEAQKVIEESCRIGRCDD